MPARPSWLIVEKGSLRCVGTEAEDADAMQYIGKISTSSWQIVDGFHIRVLNRQMLGWRVR